MSDAAPLFYRFRDVLEPYYGCSDGVTLEDLEDPQQDVLRVVKSTYRGVKRTRCGWWIEPIAYTSGKPRFVKDLTEEEKGRRRYPPRRYAYEDERLAISSYVRRKELQRWHASFATARAARGIEQAKALIAEMEKELAHA